MQRGAVGQWRTRLWFRLSGQRAVVYLEIGSGEQENVSWSFVSVTLYSIKRARYKPLIWNEYDVLEGRHLL
jgi:hypothetical protein